MPAQTEPSAQSPRARTDALQVVPWLDEDGALVINADDQNQDDFPSETGARVIRYGTSSSEARLEDVEDRGLLGSRFRLVLCVVLAVEPLPSRIPRKDTNVREP